MEFIGDEVILCGREAAHKSTCELPFTSETRIDLVHPEPPACNVGSAAQ